MYQLFTSNTEKHRPSGGLLKLISHSNKFKHSESQLILDVAAITKS